MAWDVAAGGDIVLNIRRGGKVAWRWHGDYVIIGVRAAAAVAAL
jgi:hypothetical protein